MEIKKQNEQTILLISSSNDNCCEFAGKSWKGIRGSPEGERIKGILIIDCHHIHCAECQTIR